MNYDEDSSKQQIHNILGFYLSEKEKNKLIVQKIINEAEDAAQEKDFLTPLLDFFNWGKTDLKNKYYFFNGSEEEWSMFLNHKKEKNTNTFFLYKPVIKIKNFLNKEINLTLNPGGLLFSKGNIFLFVFAHSLRPNSTYFPEFLFYYLSLEKYLGIEIEEFFIAWIDEDNSFQLSNSLPIAKKVNKHIETKWLNICSGLGLEESKAELPFTFIEDTRRDISGKEKEVQEIIESLELQKKHFLRRMELLSCEAHKFIQEAHNIETISDWYQKINWKKVISANSLESNYETAKSLKLFEINTNIYKQTLQFLYPNLSLFSSSLFGIKNIFELIKKKDINYLKSHQKNDLFWNHFLSFCYAQFFDIQSFKEDSILSTQGFKDLNSKLLKKEWKVYYDFESYLDTLTQLSLQIFRYEEIYCKKNLILEKASKIDTFEEEIILKLAIPILECSKDLNISESLEELKRKIVYISFNKTFECEWLKKLSEKYKESNQKLSKLSTLIRWLTIDLSDWFKFSKNLSLNLIGPLKGAHSLKKLNKLVSEKQYSNLDLIRDGRVAQLFFFSFYLLQESLDNTTLSPKNWIIKERKPSFLKEELKKYCELDVENMVFAVNWLEKKYKSSKGKLVDQKNILNFIAWFKKCSLSKYSDLIRKYIDWKGSY